MRFWAFIISQLIALSVHLYLTIQHYKFKFGLAEGKSLCNINAFLDCDAVNLSPFSSLFGAPLALWGFLANAVLLAFVIFYAHQNHAAKLARIAAAFIALTSVVMAVISFTQIKSLCLFCFAAYISSFVTLFVLSKWPSEKSESSLLAAPNRTWLAIGIIGVPAATLFLNHVFYTNYASGLDRIVKNYISEWKSSPSVIGAVSGLQKGAEPSKASMLIVEFADFQCIHCKNASPILSNFVKTRPDVSLVFLSFPLDGVCNPHITQKGDGRRCELAKAVYCAGLQNKGWEIHDWIFENFQNPELSALQDFAEKSGINADQFRACRSDSATHAAIEEMANIGKKAGVMGTPAIYVNGRALSGGSFLAVLEAAYNEIKSAQR